MKLLNLLPLLLLFSGQIQGSTEMFLPTVKELTISFPEDMLPENYTVLWRDHLNKTIGTYYLDGKTKVEKRLKEKVRIPGPRALTFVSLQELDSGIYSAKVIRAGFPIIKYMVTFQVSPGELKVDVISNSSFNITITCSMENVEISSTFICKNNTCRLEGGERSEVTKSGASFRLYLLNSTIIYSYSNQISKTQNQTTMQPIYTSKVPTQQTDSETDRVLYVVLGVIGGLLLLGVAWCILKKKSNCGGKKSRRATSPDIPLQTSQQLLGNHVFPSRDDQIV